MTLGRLSCIVTEDSDRLGSLKRESVVRVLEKDGGGSTVLADVLTVVFADIPGGGAGKIPIALPGVNRGEGVQPASGRVDGWEVNVLAEPVVRGHLADDHVVDSVLGDSAVADHCGDVAAEVGADTVGGAVVAKTARHVHVKSTLNGRNTAMGRTPITHNVALETKFGLQDSVLGLGVLASIRAVESLVGAHERGGTGLHGVRKGPEVELVHGPVVNVGRERLLNNGVEGRVRVVGWVALSLLLVADEMLGRCLHAGVLVTHDGLVHADTSEVGVGGETLPVAARVCRATQRAGDGAIQLSAKVNDS